MYFPSTVMSHRWLNSSAYLPDFTPVKNYFAPLRQARQRGFLFQGVPMFENFVTYENQARKPTLFRGGMN